MPKPTECKPARAYRDHGDRSLIIVARSCQQSNWPVRRWGRPRRPTVRVAIALFANVQARTFYCARENFTNRLERGARYSPKGCQLPIREPERYQSRITARGSTTSHHPRGYNLAPAALFPQCFAALQASPSDSRNTGATPGGRFSRRVEPRPYQIGSKQLNGSCSTPRR
jgi:hypothetical protein